MFISYDLIAVVVHVVELNVPYIATNSDGLFRTVLGYLMLLVTSCNPNGRWLIFQALQPPNPPDYLLPLVAMWRLHLQPLPG